MTEGSNIQLKNIQLITEESDPVVAIHNSQNIAVDNLTYPTDSKLLFNVSGEKSKGIIVSKTDAMKAKTKAEFNFGANAGALVYKQ
jgi:hypothetical protein